MMPHRALEQINLKSQRARLVSFLRGYLAGRQGSNLGACPFPIFGHVLARPWADGWTAGAMQREREQNEEFHRAFCPCCNGGACDPER
jgi:ribosome modulation factor